jgi:hypothetical protein
MIAIPPTDPICEATVLGTRKMPVGWTLVLWGGRSGMAHSSPRSLANMVIFG